MSTVTKHQRILETVRNRIQSGEFLPGERLPTDAELVSEFKASRPTVAKALQELERAGLLVRRPGAGTFVQVATDGQKAFGLLIPGLGTTEIFEPICAEIARCAQLHNHSLVWGATAPRDAFPEDRGRLALELCDRFVRESVAGVFFAPLELATNKDDVNDRIIATFHNAGIPVILLDRDYKPYPERSNFDLVGIDNRRVGYTVAEHLYGQGAQRIVFLAKPKSAATIDARVAGFAEAVLKRGLNVSQDLVHRCNPRDQDAVSRLMNSVSRPDGIVCGNDVTAGELLRTLDELGIDVPQDVMVAGIDDVRFAELLRVPLTTMHQPCLAIGEAAFQAMLQRIATPTAPPRDILLGCELIQRKSTNAGAV